MFQTLSYLLRPCSRTVAANASDLTGRSPSSRLDVVSATPAPSSSPSTPSARRLDSQLPALSTADIPVGVDALATTPGGNCRLGVGYRAPLAKWIHRCPAQINCLEITAEHFFDHPAAIEKLRDHYPLMVHGLGLSLGTPGPLDQHYVNRFVEVCRLADPLWVSEHIAFTRAGDLDLGHLNPIAYTDESLAGFAERVLALQSACDKPVLLENITSHLQIVSPMAETDFINGLCDKTGCGLLLDVTNLYVNSRNHRFDPHHWLRQIQPECIKQLHIVGYSERDGVWHDSHDSNIQHELFTLTREVVRYSSVDTVIIERDHNFPPPEQLAAELRALAQCFDERAVYCSSVEE